MRQIYLIVIVLTVFVPLSTQAQICGSTNIALGRPVTVLNQWVNGPGSSAVDGNTGTAWFNDPGYSNDTNYLYVDLGQSYTFCKIKIIWESDGRGKNYVAQTSTDATNWTDIFTRTNNSALTDSFSVIGTGRYLRIYMTAKVNFWANYTIKELEIYNYLSNFNPHVSLTAPVNNSSTVAGTNIILSANAYDPDGSVTKVEFYQDTVKVGESTTAPYNYTLYNVQPGNYVFKAKAYDNSNADSLSTAVNVTVNPSNRWSLTGNGATNPDSNFVGTLDNKKLVFKTNNTKRMTIHQNGFVGIGIDSVGDADVKFGVNGTIAAKKLKITQSAWPDYVFEDDYKLMPLSDLENYISKNKHLPGILTAKQVQKNGSDVADTQEALLRKIEELTLYIIEQNKKLKALTNKVERQQIQLKKINPRARK